MISSISLSNWRCHSSTKLKFKKGTNLIVGKMGSGKSSVLEAISFALFGTFPSLKRGRTKLSDIIARESNSASVSLAFTLDGKNYEVNREIGERGNELGMYICK